MIGSGSVGPVGPLGPLGPGPPPPIGAGCAPYTLAVRSLSVSVLVVADTYTVPPAGSKVTVPGGSPVTVTASVEPGLFVTVIAVGGTSR